MLINASLSDGIVKVMLQSVRMSLVSFVQLPTRAVGREQLRGLLVLDSDLGGAASLGQFIAVAVGVAVLAARESGAALREWTARLTLRSALAGLRAVFKIGAERSVATDGAWSLAIPRWEATETAWAAGEAWVERHVAEAIDDVVRGVVTLAHTIRGSHQSWRGRLSVLSAELLETRNIVAQCSREARSRRNW